MERDMFYILMAVFLLSYLLLMRVFGWCHARHRRSRLSNYLYQSSWERQRWANTIFNGRHTLGFGYFLHRST